MMLGLLLIAFVLFLFVIGIRLIRKAFGQ